ncbi:hypothetical protein J7U46_07950 [Pelomonas sp. V22]|uniref:PKD domain-containing protein n=1 Tax=Pelomonas sp. V22 TaxID=2822139 RepID=UPI0024A965F5|nr:hypothetical protein [Pelomonas sp. V22]MDI4632979.1 hypothetical protein [Pelomonas sp. V22]
MKYIKHEILRRPLARCTALAASLVLLGCGGGGGGAGSSSTTTTPTTPTTPVNLVCSAGTPSAQVLIDGPLVGKQAAAAIAGCSGPISKLQWTQTSGPTVSLLSAQTQVIHFEPTVAGDYGFRVSYTDVAGAAQTRDVTLNITAPTTPAKAIVRNHQAVRMGGKVSIRAWSTSGEAVQNVSWAQLEGPTVDLQTVDSLARQFVAPTVTQDTLLRFRATVQMASGTDSQEVIVLVEKQDQAPANNNTYIWSGDHVSRVHAYRPAGSYASVLVGCVYEPLLTAGNACTVGRLPLLGQESGGTLPTIEQVMNRVVVSHDWQGANFERFLQQQDTRGDFRRMLMSTTAVVIGSHVRPSFYQPATGAIYLDADNVWMTPAERDTIDEAPDYRAAYTVGLQFQDIWRYAKGSDYYSAFFDPALRVTRTMADVEADLAPLLYHELSHANDFIAPETYASLNQQPGINLNTFVGNRYNQGVLVSDLMKQAYPLTSSELQSLGQVKFQGATATTAQKAYTATQVGALFAADLASDMYAYSSRFEDLAMTVEESLMSLRLGIARDTAFVPRTDTAIVTSDVRWGQRGRIGDPRLRARLKLAAAKVVPWMAAADFDKLPAPLQMRVGDSWRGNLVLPAPLTASSVVKLKAQQADLRAEYEEAGRLAQWARRAQERDEAHQRVERRLGQR